MSIKGIVKTLEEVPEALREFYKQSTDGFRLDVTDVEFSPDVTGLRATLKKERDRADAAEKSLREANEKIEETSGQLAKLTELDPAKEADRIAAQKIEAFKADQKKMLETEIGKRDTQIKTLDTNLRRVMIENAAVEAITKHKGRVAVLKPHVTSLMDLEYDEKTGQYRTVVKDQFGNVRSGDARGDTLMTAEQLVEEFKKNADFEANFEASGKSGAGSPPKADDGHRARSVDGQYDIRADGRGVLRARPEDILAGKAVVRED